MDEGWQVRLRAIGNRRAIDGNAGAPFPLGPFETIAEIGLMVCGKVEAASAARADLTADGSTQRGRAARRPGRPVGS